MKTNNNIENKNKEVIILSKDTTISFRGSDELKEKVTVMIEGSGLTQKEWYEKAISLAEINSLKEGAKDYSKDLSELEMHTQRIYELIGNMVKRAGYEKDAVERKLDEVKVSQNEVITDYQQKLKAEIELRKEADKQTKASEENEEKLKEQFSQLQKANASNEDLIGEYKEKIDSLSSLVTEYRGYADENKRLQIAMNDLKEKNRSSIQEMQDTVNDVTHRLENTQSELNKKEQEQEAALKTLTDQLNFEKEKALLEADKKNQAQIASANENYNKKIGELYESIEETRKTYDNKVDIMASKHAQETADQKAYFEKEIEILKEQLRS